MRSALNILGAVILTGTFAHESGLLAVYMVGGVIFLAGLGLMSLIPND